MNLPELRTFLAIVETGSLVKASKKLHVTQSTVTVRLKSLEDELGQTLINRQKSGASLTASGVRLKRYAETISDLWRQARQEISVSDSVSSVCNLACHPDLWAHSTERLFDYIQQSQPNVALSVWQGGQSDLANWMANGLVDICVTYWPTSAQNRTLLPLAGDRLCLYSTREDGPMKFDPNYVYVEAGEEFGREHAAAYADADTARISFGTAELGLKHILAQGGSAYLPARIAEPYVDADKLHRVQDAQEFQRRSFVVANNSALVDWPWFSEAMEVLTGPEA